MNAKKAISIGMATIILLTLASAMPAAAYPYTTLHVTYTLGHSVFACGALNDTGLAMLKAPTQFPAHKGYNTSTGCWAGGDWWEDMDAYSHEWAHDNNASSVDSSTDTGKPYWKGGLKTTWISVALGRIYPGESRHIYFATENYANTQLRFNLSTQNIKNRTGYSTVFPTNWTVDFKILNDYGYDPINVPPKNCPNLTGTPINHFTVLSHDDYFNLYWTGVGLCTHWHNPSTQRAIPIDRGACDISQHPLEPAYNVTHDHSNLYHVLELSIDPNHELNSTTDPVSFDIVVERCKQ